MTQVWNAAWALLGIPFIIGAGVGMLYRIESQLRMYFWYSLTTFFLNCIWWLSFLYSGDLCKTIVGKEVQHMGTAFVCGFTDTFVFFWMLIAILVDLYCVYIIWSAAEEAGRSSYPELMKYSSALKSHLLPLPTGGVKEEKKTLKIEEKKNKNQPLLTAPVYGAVPPPPPMAPAFAPAPITATYHAPPPMTSMPVGMPISMPAPSMPMMPASGTPQSFIPSPLSGVSGGQPISHGYETGMHNMPGWEPAGAEHHDVVEHHDLYGKMK